jgi:hypothetical protein
MKHKCTGWAIVATMERPEVLGIQTPLQNR